MIIRLQVARTVQTERNQVYLNCRCAARSCRFVCKAEREHFRGVCAARTVQAERNGARSNSLTKVRVWRCIAEAPPVLAPFSGANLQRFCKTLFTSP